jgi:hypothetical protein
MAKVIEFESEPTDEMFLATHDVLPKAEIEQRIAAFRAANLALIELLGQGVDPHSQQYIDAYDLADCIIAGKS